MENHGEMAKENAELDDPKEESESLFTEVVHDADVLEKVMSHVGDMGRYQNWMVLAMIPMGFTNTLAYFVQMFLTVTPQNHWCRVPELSNLTMELRRNLSAPGAITGLWHHCMTFDTNWTEVLNSLTPPPDETPLIPCQHGWEFELSDIPYATIASERQWVCKHASYVPSAQSVFFSGSVIGCFIFGPMADRFGRVPVIIGSYVFAATNLLGAIGGIGTIFTTSFWDFVVCRFIVGLSYDNCLMIMFILVLEYVGPKYRTWIANLSLALSFGVAGIILPWMAYYIANWRMLSWVTSLPMLFVVLVPLFMPESVRWLVSRGRILEAVAIIKRFEKINKKKIPDDVMNEFIISSEKMTSEKTQSIFSMCKSLALRKAMISLILVFMGCEIVIDGLIRLSDTFGLSFFAVFSFNEVAEFVSIVLVGVILDRLGRRNSASSTALLSSVFLVITVFMSDGVAKAFLVILSRFFMNTCYTASMLWCTEIIPTPFRVSGASILHMSAFLAVILSPFIVYSEHLWHMLPMIIFTGVAFLTATVCLTLPDTKGLPMPQTIADCEKIYRGHSICGKPEGAEEEP